MIFRPLLFLCILLILLIGILLLRKASLEGKLVIAFAFLAIAAYFRLHFYLLLLTSMSLFAFIAVALMWAWIASSRLRLVREVKKEAMVGENVPVTYRIANRAILPLFHARVWDTIYRERTDNQIENISFEDPGYLGFLRIQRREESAGSLHFMPPVRGLVKFGPVAIEGGDPFGIFTLTKWHPIGDECLVLPTWVRLNAVPTISGRLGAREQEHLVSREGQSHEFLGIRPYSNGDSLRGVHWPLTAKHDTLIVRQFQREVEEEMLVILDADKRADVGEGAENALEYLITLALSLVNAASDLSRPWNLVIAGENIGSISYNEKEPLLQVQYALAKLRCGLENPIEDALEELRYEFHNATCILLTSRVDDGPREALKQWGARVGDGLGSILVRVDLGGFTTTISDSRVALKRRGKRVEVSRQPDYSGVSAVSELTVTRGDKLADLFLGHVRA